MLCLVGCGIGLVVGEDDRLTDVQRDERQVERAISWKPSPMACLRVAVLER